MEPLTAGERLRQRLLNEAHDVGIEYDERELALIDEACHTADLIAALDAAIAEHGVIRNGQVSGVVREARLQRLTLQKLLAGLDLTGTKSSEAQISANARKAANARWANRGR